MSHYGYQYKQQWYIPSGMKGATPSFTQCHKPCVVKCTSGTSRGADLCGARNIVQSIPKCSEPCTTRCVETRIMEDLTSQSSLHTNPCSTRSPTLCNLERPQLHLQGWENLGVPQCGQPCIPTCSGTCGPAYTSQHYSHPYSYQWSKSYSYGSGNVKL
uniref:Uncharacterized protein n=1 Tax=Apteryx owenii TaxID=8824 RepID=A0A8B9QIQ0_APTOW